MNKQSLKSSLRSDYKQSLRLGLKQKGLAPIAIVLLIAAVIGGYFIYQRSINNSPTLPKEDRTTYILGNFNISLPSSEIAVSDGDFYGKFHQTKLDPDACSNISGIKSLYLEKNNPQPKEGYSKARIYIYQWNYQNLQYANDDSREQFRKYTEDLITKLPNFQDETKLRNSILSKDFPQYPYLGTNFGTCGGIFSIPFLISKIDTSKFDLAYFAEVTEGNGGYSYPNRALVIKKDDSWLIIKEEQGVSSDNWLCVKDWENTVSNEEKLKCAVETWAKEYRNDTENQQWIQKMLNNIEYTSSKFTN